MKKKNCKHCGIEFVKPRGGACNPCRLGLNRYGMNRLDMIELHKSQDGKCSLCEKEVIMFNRGGDNCGVIDHNHTTGNVRGILCFSCNYAIGLVEERIGLDKVSKYLSVAQLDLEQRPSKPWVAGSSPAGQANY